MTDFEWAKEHLVYEKARLEAIVAAQCDLLGRMKIVDGKIYNKKIIDHIKENETLSAYQNSEKFLTVSLRNSYVAVKAEIPRDDYRPSCVKDVVFEASKEEITDEAGGGGASAALPENMN